jgi:hypothetical protein
VGRGNEGGEWGVKSGECGTVSGRGGVVGAADRVGPPVSEGEAMGQAGPKGKGGRWATAGPERKGGRWAAAGLKSLLRLKSKKVKENQFLIDFWIKIRLEIE